MDVVATSPLPLPLSLDHHMNQASSNSSTPYMSATSSPQHPHTHTRTRPRPPLDFFFYSAPTSPRSHTSRSLFDDVYHDYPSDHVALLKHDSCIESSSCCSSPAAVPFDWELKPGVAKTSNEHDHLYQDLTQMKEEKEEDFQFEFSGQLDMMVMPCLSSADELFDGGKIRPLKLKPPPSLHISHDNKISSCHSSPKSPKSTMSKFKDALSMSPKHRRYVSDLGPDHDPFEAAIRNARKSQFHSRSLECEWKRDSNDNVAAYERDDDVQNRGRGRDRVKPIKDGDTKMSMNKRGGNNSRAGISRSLSPLRVSEFALLQHQDQQNLNEPCNSTGIFGRGSSNNGCSKKWRLKDLFLFRSASEGHYKGTQSYSKRWSFRSTSMVSSSVSGSESGSVSKRRGQTSTHEMIYTKNRAVSEELKKKTVLPYRHGLLACLGFSPVLPQFSYAFPNNPPS